MENHNLKGTDVPSQIRELFSTSRMKGAWALLSSAEGGERQAAIEAIARLLSVNGLSFADVLSTILEVPSATSASRKPMPGFGDIFSHMMDQAFTRPPNAQPKQTQVCPTPIVQGTNIPPSICGRIRIQDERPTRTGRMLVIGVNAQEAIYEPIVAFADNDIEALKAAAEADRMVTMKVRPPANYRQMPAASQVL